jgi:hypothetical protein
MLMHDTILFLNYTPFQSLRMAQQQLFIYCHTNVNGLET